MFLSPAPIVGPNHVCETERSGLLFSACGEAGEEVRSKTL